MPEVGRREVSVHVFHDGAHHEDELRHEGVARRRAALADRSIWVKTLTLAKRRDFSLIRAARRVLYVHGMNKAMILSVLAALAMGCSATETSSDDEELSTVALGVDTNGTTLDVAYAKSRGIGFVGRYISFDGTHPALTAEEAKRFHDGGMPLVLIWEVDQDRAFQEQSLSGQRALGTSDGNAAKTALQQCGAYGQAVYFTVDFDVTDALWKTTMKDSKTGNQITVGDLIVAYFKGINSVLGAARTGAYGTYTVLHELFDQGRIAYGWQQTFNKHAKDPRDKRAQLRQYAFGYDTTGWGVAGAGALDYDRAVHAKYGQW